MKLLTYSVYWSISMELDGGNIEAIGEKEMEQMMKEQGK